MTDSLKVQHGGQHYKGMGIQPVEFAMVNGYDPCAFSTLKYVSRHRQKGGKLDLEKGLHFVQLRVDMLVISEHVWAGTPQTRIGISDYCEANKLGDHESKILVQLHRWVLASRSVVIPKMAADYADPIIQSIHELIEEAYP